MEEELSDEYKLAVKRELTRNILMRHLWSKRLSTVSVQIQGDAIIEGVLKAIDVFNQWVEIEATKPVDKTFYINLHKVVYVETADAIMKEKPKEV